MIVIADASPLIALVQLSHLEILPALFGEVLIPPDVLSELRAPNRSNRVRDVVNTPPSWLAVRPPSKIEPIPTLDAGETAAICLAIELNAELLLIDESKGRRAAVERHLTIIGTIGVLELAAYRGLLDLADAFARLKKTDFWISNELLDERLDSYLRRQKS